jgi:hypothetical protein
MNDNGVQLNWGGQPFRPGSGFGYGGREENISNERPTVQTVITESDLAAIFENGSLPRAEAAKVLQAFTGASRATCYRALDLKGRFAKRLRDQNGMLAWQH